MSYSAADVMQMTATQVDEDIKLINQFLKECGERTFINKTAQDIDTIIELIQRSIEFSKKLIRSDIDRYEVLTDVCMRAFEYFNTQDTILAEQRLMASEHSGLDSDLSSGSGSPRSMSLSPPRRDSGSPHSDSDLSGSDSSVELGDLPSTPPQVLAERQRIAHEEAQKKPAKTVLLFSATAIRRTPPPPPKKKLVTPSVDRSAVVAVSKIPLVPKKKPPSYRDSLTSKQQALYDAIEELKRLVPGLKRDLNISSSREEGMAAAMYIMRYTVEVQSSVDISIRGRIADLSSILTGHFKALPKTGTPQKLRI